jgi:hypothetical protein
MFYGLRVNAALVRLGCTPMAFASAFRTLLQKEQLAADKTPQEVALVMAAQLPIVRRAAVRSAVVQRLIGNGEIDPEKHEVRAALIRLGLIEVRHDDVYR